MAQSDSERSEANQRAHLIDPLALEQVFDAFAPQVSRYIYFRISDDSQAETLHALVFQKYLELTPRQRSLIDNLPAWFFETAQKLVDQHIELSSRENSDHNPQDRQAQPSPDEGSPEIAWLKNLVQRALKRLISEQQHLLALRFGVRLPLDEIARLMDEPVSQVKSLQVDALLALRRLLEIET